MGSDTSDPFSSDLLVSTRHRAIDLRLRIFVINRIRTGSTANFVDMSILFYFFDIF